jgi:hypothetical protein
MVFLLMLRCKGRKTFEEGGKVERREEKKRIEIEEETVKLLLLVSVGTC